MAFLHNGQVRGEYGVKHIVNAHSLKRVHNLAYRGILWFQSDLLAPCGADCRRHLRNDDLILIGQSLPHLTGIASLPESAHRTMGNTLSAEGTVGFFDRLMTCYIHRRTRTGSFKIPDIQALHLIADLNTAHTFDTFCRIADKREMLVPWLVFQFLLKRDLQDIQIIGDLLETAVTASHTGYAQAVMLRQDKLHRISPVISDLRAVRIDDHSLLGHIITCGDQPLFSFQFHNTYPACGDLVDSFQITKAWDRDPVLIGSFHDRGIFFYRNLFSVYCKIYHNFSLPPLNIPYPK